MVAREPMQRLVVQVTARHKVALGQIARQDGEPAAAVLRRLILTEAQERGLWPSPDQARKEAAHA
jgi:hypothetical protein